MSKRKFPSTEREWFDYALFYCSNRETSRPKLRAYLIRKLKATKPTEETFDESQKHIETALDKCERLKIIDHERYAGMLAREYQRRGKGSRYIIQKLQHRGLKEEVSKLEVIPEEELSRAIDTARKQLSRPSVKRAPDIYAMKTKILQRLIAAGFDFQVSKKAIEEALKES